MKYELIESELIVLVNTLKSFGPETIEFLEKAEKKLNAAKQIHLSQAVDFPKHLQEYGLSFKPCLSYTSVMKHIEQEKLEQPHTINNGVTTLPSITTKCVRVRTY